MIYLLLPLAFAQKGAISSITNDADGDGVIDAYDRCDGSDDTVDLNADGVADCAQTLIANATFDTGLTSWHGDSGGYATISHDSSADGGAWAYSGALYAVADGYAGFGFSIDSGCVSVDAGNRHLLLLQADLDANSTSSPGLFARVQQYTSYSKCLQRDGATAVVDFQTGVSGGWLVLGDAFETAQDTAWLRVRFSVSQLNANSAHVWIDNVLLLDVDDSEYEIGDGEQ